MGVAAIRPLNRLETLGETMRAALNSLAVAAPNRLAKRLKKIGLTVSNEQSVIEAVRFVLDNQHRRMNSLWKCRHLN